MAKKSKPKFSLTLQLGDKLFQSVGMTVLEALTNLKTPEKLLNKGVVTLTHGTKRAELLLFPQRLKLFLRPIARPYQAKNLEAILK